MQVFAPIAKVDPVTLESTVLLKCVHCGGVLETSQQEVQCPECGAHWPFVGGIPRFYREAAYYWGEVSYQQSTALLAEARKSSWQHSLRTLITNQELRDYYFDPQRAGWLALLGVAPTAVALDVGCGYGAITHSLALSVQTVFAVEAVSERIEFTQERLRQEGIKNVTLLQSCATALPFFDSSFDLIVANGILEWIGEWDLDGSPRAAQLRFLSSLQRLLKDDGVLVIGIENRFGMGALRGGLDHSGKRYTSLVPRRIATMMLRHGKQRGQHLFWTSNCHREYRTYTYSHYGYRKLLEEAGYGKVSLYLAKPGYNRPHHLIPFGSRPLLRDYYSANANLNGQSGGKLRSTGSVQVLLGKLYASLAGEFVIIALKDRRLQNGSDFWLREVLSRGASAERGGFGPEEELVCSVGTHYFGHKSILRFWNRRVGMINAIAKFSSRNGQGKAGDLNSEFRKLDLVWQMLSHRPELSVSVPKPIGYLCDGKNAYMVESCARGERMWRLVSHRRHSRRFEQLRADFGKVIKASIELSKALQTLPGVSPIDPAWRRLPDEIARDASLAERVTCLRYFSHTGGDEKPSWIQHGDFFPGNIFFSKKTGRFDVIDWADLASGFPPLYDLFSLIILAEISAYTQPRAADLPRPQLLEASFLEIFIEKSELNLIFSDLLAEACAQFQLSPALIPSLLVEFLLVREHYERARYEDVPAQQYSNMLRAYLQTS